MELSYNHLLRVPSSARLANINVGGALKAGTSLLQSENNANHGASADIGLIGLAVM